MALSQLILNAELDEYHAGERRDVRALGLHDSCCFKELGCLPTFKQEMTVTEISPLRRGWLMT